MGETMGGTGPPKAGLTASALPQGDCLEVRVDLHLRITSAQQYKRRDYHGLIFLMSIVLLPIINGTMTIYMFHVNFLHRASVS